MCFGGYFYKVLPRLQSFIQGRKARTMSRTDKSTARLRSAVSSSAQSVSRSCIKKDKEKPDLLLTGSQIHPACRPKWGNGKSGSPFISVSDICSARSMSAIPAFGDQVIYRAGENGTQSLKRPKSANNPYIPEGILSVSSSAISDSDGTIRIAHTQYNCTCMNNFCAEFSLLDDDNCVTEGNPHNTKTEPVCGFGATYICPSSELFTCVTSEPLGHTWTKSELKACCEELGIEDYICKRYERESASSDCSKEQCNSERSLGEQITAMAQNPQPAKLPHALLLEPGLASKPHVAEYSLKANGCIQTPVHSRDRNFDEAVNYKNILYEESNHGCSLMDKPYIVEESTHSQDKYMVVSGDPDGKNSYTCSMMAMIFSDKHESGLVCNVPEDKIVKLHCSSMKDGIPVNRHFSSNHVSEPQPGERKQDFSEHCENLIELKNQPLTQNLLHNVCADVPSDIGETKVQYWFSDSVGKDSEVSDSLVCKMERKTDIVHTNLVNDQYHLDYSTSSHDLGITVVHEGDMNSVYTGKPTGQELYLECLVGAGNDEYGGSTSMKTDGNGKQCSLPNSGHHNMNVKKQGNDSVAHNNMCSGRKSEESEEYVDLCTESTVVLPDNRTDMSHPKTRFDTSVAVPDNRTDMSHPKTQFDISVAVPDNRTDMSCQNTQFESPEQCEQFLNIPAEATQSSANDLILHKNLTLRNVEHNIVKKSGTPFLLDNISVLSPPTSMPTQNLDLNVSTVKPLGTSTYNDIVTILKVLEQEESSSFPKLDHLKSYPDTEISCNEGLLNPVVSNNTQNTSVTGGKLRDILTFLDEVERCCDTTSESAKTQFQSVVKKQNNQLLLTEVPRMEELLNLSTVDLAHEVLTLHLQLEEKSSSINLLQETLKQQRELSVRNAKNADRDRKIRLREQKDQYESAVARHQKFIDQLIADKKCLSEKCESLVLGLKKSEEHHTNTLKAVEHRHSVELQRAREMHAAAERLRRERWIDNKTKKIKEMTVKGLEPELHRITTMHQQDISDLRLLHKQELEELELRAARKTAQQMEHLRELLSAEKEEALARDKELLRHRFEKEAEQEKLEYQAQQCRLLAEIQREKERLTERETRLNQELEETKQSLSTESAKVIERLKQEHQEIVEACTRRHQNEVVCLKEALEIEKEAWMLRCKKDQTTQFSERESEIRNQCKRERDKEIELIIERLESDATQSRAELQQAMDNRLRRLKEKFDAEISDLEVSEKSIKCKFNETKGKLMEREDEVIKLKTNARQLEKELEEAKKIVDRLSAERAEIKEVLRKELTSQVTAAEQENIRLREEISELRTAHKLELSGKADEVARIMKDKEKQLQQVYNRVRLAVAKKDETIQKMKLQYESAMERCSYLEDLLEQQRRDFLLN